MTAQPNDSGPADLVLTNANVITMDPTQPAARAVAVRAGRILAVGSDQDAQRSPASTTPTTTCSAPATT
jgi:predicted amidohydrolase YtcJ